MDAVMELEIGPGPEPGTFVVHVLRSVGGGEPSTTFALNLDELLDRRPALEDSVLSSSVAARRIVSATEAPIQGVGRLLFDSVFDGEVDAAYRTSLAVASDRGKGVQIVLRLRAPGLAALPWEALYDAETGTYLCRKEPLVRHVPAPYSPPILTLTPPLRVLGMISSPRGLPPLDIDGEKQLLEEALRPHLDADRVTIDWIDHVTWPHVHDKLLEHEWHVLHFIGHGTYDAETDEGILAFVGRDGRADYVSASSFADLLGQAEPSPRLVLLNSCRSGVGGTEDLFSGTAAALVQSGIHAVAAMQFSVSDIAAIEFARGFYAALAHGRGIDEAVRSGRIGMLGVTRGTLEWVTPVLYLRGEDTQLFDVAAAPDAAHTPQLAPKSRPGTLPDTNPDLPAQSHIPPGTQAAINPSHSLITPHAPDSGDIPVGSIPIIRPTLKPATGSSSPTEKAKRPSGTSVPEAGEPPAIPEPATPATTPSNDATLDSSTGSTPASTPVAPLRTTATRAVPTSPPRAGNRPNAGPPKAPPSGRPKAGGAGRQRPSRRWMPWLVVAVLVASIGGAAAVIGLNSNTDPPPPPGTDPEPLHFTVDSRDQWTNTELQCKLGDTFELTATGRIDLDGSGGEPAVGPAGWLDGQTGLRSAYRDGWENAGALYVGDSSLLDGLEGASIDQYTRLVENQTIAFRCDSEYQIMLMIDDSDTTDNEGKYEVDIRPPQ